MKSYPEHLEKLKDAVRLIIDQCEPHELGQVKLHKALYFSDMLRYLDVGKPITGCVYRKRPFGPTCDRLLSVLKEMERDGELIVRKVDFHGYAKSEFIKASFRNSSSLDDSEAKLISEVVHFVCKNNTASTISELSHDSVWQSVEFGQDIPYYLALSWLPSIVDDAAHDWAKEVVSDLADQGRHAAALAGRARPSLRERMASRA